MQASEADQASDKDVQTLIKTTHFGFGPIRGSASITEGEAALRRIMQREMPIKFLFSVFEQATLAGKCYALVGFRLLDPEFFAVACNRIERWKESRVKVVSGCEVSQLKVEEVLQSIREGRYDEGLLEMGKDESSHEETTASVHP